MPFDPLTVGQAGVLQICMPDQEQMNVCIFMCVSTWVYQECEEWNFCLQASFQVVLMGVGGWNSIELISQRRFRVGCEIDTGLIRSVYFKWFICIRECQLLEVVFHFCTVLINLFLSVLVCRIRAVSE